MKTWKVVIPPPSAERLNHCRTVIVISSNGWEGGSREEYKLQDGQTELSFQLPPAYEWLHGTSVNDGRSFAAVVRSRNSTGSREEFQTLTPEEVK